METLTDNSSSETNATDAILDPCQVPVIIKEEETISKEDVTNQPTRLTLSKIITLIILVIANLAVALIVSLQAPFYPAEAESRGASATEYGFVFASYELVALLVSPFYGKYMSFIGVTFMMKSSLFLVAFSCISFGFLDLIFTRQTFIGLSIFIRIIESLGGTAYFIASTTVIAQEFPDSIGSTFALLELCFGLGLIGGPTIGGALFQIGGFRLPFFSLGSFLLFAALITFFVLPNLSGKRSDAVEGSLAVLKIFPVALAIFTVACSSCSIGFLVTTIEPHLRQFNLTPVVVGGYLAICGGTYAFTASFWGWLSDRTGKTKIFYAIGAMLICCCYLFLGPAPFIPMKPKLWLCGIALALHGLGQAAELVCGLSGALKSASEYGYPNDVSTYAMVSSLFTMAFATGAFLGPSLAGVLTDHIGFQNATMFTFSLHAFVAIVTVTYLLKRQSSHAKTPSRNIEFGTTEETTSLINKENR